MSLIQQFKSREASPLVQFIKYGIAGCAATGVHICVFYLCSAYLFEALDTKDLVVKFLGFPAAEVTEAVRARNAMINNIIAFFMSNSVAYITNVLWVFEAGRHKRVVEILMFFAVSAISMAVGTPIMGALIRFVGMTTTMAFGANIVVAVLVNYAARKFLIFKG